MSELILPGPRGLPNDKGNGRRRRGRTVDACRIMPGVKLFLVRHAMPAFGPDVPAAAWELSSQGWSAARALARALPVEALLVASREPKARQTLEPAGSVQTDERFNEVTRDEPYEGDFRTRRRAYVTGTDHAGPVIGVARYCSSLEGGIGRGASAN